MTKTGTPHRCQTLRPGWNPLLSLSPFLGSCTATPYCLLVFSPDTPSPQPPAIPEVPATPSLPMPMAYTPELSLHLVLRHSDNHKLPVCPPGTTHTEVPGPTPLPPTRQHTLAISNSAGPWDTGLHSGHLGAAG